MSCEHYDRGCFLQAPCCKEWYPCRICHNEEKEHEMNRHAITRVRCRKCRHEQSPQEICEKCHFQFGKYFCHLCNLFDNEVERKKIYHCDECGICRVGGKENFFHCKKCGGCYPVKGRETHRCVDGVMLQECCICFEDMFHSRESPNILRCGHVLHKECSISMWMNSRFECPLCRDSIPPNDDESDTNNEEEDGDEDGEEDGEDDDEEDNESYMTDDGELSASEEEGDIPLPPTQN